MVLWQLSSITPAGNYYWSGTAFGNGVFVAVGAKKTMTSNDGVTWTVRSSPYEWACITFGNGFFVAVSGKNAMRSTDGINWTYQSTAPDYGWRALTYGAGVFVAVSANTNVNERIMYSGDGLNWALAPKQQTNLNYWYGVAYGNGLFVAVGQYNNGPNIMTSPNGWTWNNSVTRTPSSYVDLNAITFGAGKFVAMGSMYYATSTDGFNWSIRSFARSEIKDWRQVTYCNGLFVAVCSTNGGSYSSMVSSDGVKWTSNETPGGGWVSITTGNNYFVSVANGGQAMIANSYETPTLGSFTISSPKSYNSEFTITQPTSNSTGTFTYSSSNTSVATISGNKITFVGVGTVTITAKQAATASYTIATTTSNTITVEKATPIMGSLTIPTQYYGSAAFTLTNPTSTSDATLTYSSSNTSVATVLGNKVTLIGIGSTTITVSQAETTYYKAATTTATLNVSKGVTALGTFSISSKTYCDAAFTFKDPTSSSNGLFSYTSSNPSVASIIGNKITINGAGTTQIMCTQAATSYFDAASKSTTLTVNKASPTHGSFVLPTRYYGDSPSTLILTSNSPALITYASSNTSIASVTGNILFIRGAGGPVNITATQAESSNYLAKSTTATFSVSKANPNLGSLSLPIATYGENTSFTIGQPSAISGAEASFIYSTSDESVATITGNTVTIKGAGKCDIIATHLESTNYATSSTSAKLTVNKGTPLIGALALPSITYGDFPITITDPTSTSTGAFIYTSSDPLVASFGSGPSFKTLTFQKPGSITITATQAATTNYNAGYLDTTLEVKKITLVAGTFSLPQKTLGEEDFTITPPTIGGSTGSITYTSDNTAVATITGTNKISIKGIGTANITAHIAETSIYTSAETTASITVVAKVPASISNFVLPSQMFCGDDVLTLTAPVTNSTGAWTFTSSDTNVAVITDGNKLTVKNVGNVTITATVADTPKLYSSYITAEMKVRKGTPKLGTFTILKKAKDFGSFNVTPPTSTNLITPFTYTSSNLDVATVSGTTITLVSIGKTTITASQAETDNFAFASTSAELEVTDGLKFSVANVEGQWTDVTFGNGQFVAVSQSGTSQGANSRVMTSPDGLTWIQHKTPSDSQAHYSEWSSITYGEPAGTPLYVAVSRKWGYSMESWTYTPEIALMTSRDGISWSITDYDSLSGPYGWKSVAYGNGTFVVVGANKTNFRLPKTYLMSPNGTTIATSSDGLNWTKYNVYFESDLLHDMRSVTYVGGQFIATTSGNTLLTSPDGTNWTRTMINCDPAISWSEITYAKATYVGVGNGYTMTSSDAINWTVRVAPLNLTTVIFGGDYFVALSTDENRYQEPRAMYSSDGESWALGASGNYKANPFRQYWTGSAYGNGVMVGVAYDYYGTGKLIQVPLA